MWDMAVRHMRMMNSEIGKVVSLLREDELELKKQRICRLVPYELVEYVHKKSEDF